MKKIFSFKDFSKSEVSEAIDPAALRGAWAPEELGTYTGVDDEDPIDPVLSSTGSITLKREDFDVIVRPQDDGGLPPPPPPPPGGPPPPPPPPLPPQPRYKKKIEIVKIKDKKKKREEDAERLKRGKKKKEGKGDKEGDKQPPPALPKVGDKVILQDGTKKIVKKVLPNGDIEV